MTSTIPNLKLNLKLKSNKRSFDNKHFVYEKLLFSYNIFYEDEVFEEIEFYFDDFLEIYEIEINYFEPCIFKVE